MEERGLGSPEASDISGMRDDNINISDVIEVIETDPDFNQSNTMFNGGEEISHQHSNYQRPITKMVGQEPYVKIIEQPASKALRFRYECEGRSAGSIPGVSSSPENKTFPTIQIVGYRGRAVVVVSCVTKDAPHRPHPHNLVGREGCKKGVCTLEVSTETMSVTFSNLGIQCVKKKDIESALKLREEIRVDPFKTGFSHRNQPTSIDLNAVRLCFQVFLEGDRGKFTVTLKPVISDPIYDKKAMCDLIIVKLSHCVSIVDGGRNDIILLCEKVAKEDIQVRFYEERDGQLHWEGFGDFQPSQVHKQTAISFRPPRYKSLDVTEPVKVFIQLRRPSDGATSEPLPFEFLPLDSGRPPFWSFRRNLAKKGNYNLLNSILTNDPRFALKRPLDSISQSDKLDSAQTAVDTDVEMVAVDEVPVNPEPSRPNTEWCDYSEVSKRSKTSGSKSDERSLNDLIDQVAELDEIYSESRAISKLNQEECLIQPTETFDDARTYTSLQMAFKNPLELQLNDKDKYEDVLIVNPASPVIDVTSLKRDSELEKLPPLPPKRIRKVTDICDPYVPNLIDNVDTTTTTISQSNPNLVKKPVSRTPSLNLPRTQSHIILSAPNKKLPPTPCSTLPNPKKESGFFSKLFSKKKEQSTQSLDNLKRTSLSNSKLILLETENMNLINAQNVSAPAIDNEIVKQAEPSNDNLILTNKTSSTDLNANDDVNINLDLTEAEHYALYMAMAPHATQSEFDEMSCYYAPVEGGKIVADSNVSRLKDSKT